MSLVRKDGIAFGKPYHSYFLDGVKAPGVTTILQKAAKPGLVRWAARCAADEAVNNWEQLAELPLMERREVLLGAPDRDRDAAAGRGTEVHHLAERYINGQPVTAPDELAGHFDAAVDFLQRVRPAVVATELAVASRAEHYAGTLDLIADLPELHAGLEVIPAGRWLLDFKTGRSGVWMETALQLTAYSRAEFYVRESGGTEYPMADVGITRCGAVWLRADGWDLLPVTANDETWAYFLHLAAIDRAGEATRGWIGGAIDPPPARPIRVQRPRRVPRPRAATA